MRLSQINQRMSEVRTNSISQEGLGDNISNWVKNQMDTFSAWQYKQNNWFTQFNINAENAEEYLSSNYGYKERTKTISKFAMCYLTKAHNSADAKAILLEAIKTADTFLTDSTKKITTALNDIQSINVAELDVEKYSLFKEVSLSTELKEVEVATISPKDYMAFYKALGQINKHFLETAKAFAQSQPALRKQATEIKDASIKSKINKLIDARMRSLKLYMHFFDSIALYCEDCLYNVTTNPDEISSKESYMKNPIKAIRSGIISKEEQDVNISIKQDNDQGEEDLDLQAPAASEPEIEFNKGDAAKDKEQEIEQAVTDAQQASNIDEIATSVDALESALVIVRNLKATRQPIHAATVESLQLTVDTVLARHNRTLSVPSVESLVLDRNMELNRLEGAIMASMEGLVDDVKIWVGKQVDTLNSKFNYDKLYAQVLKEADKTASMAESYKAAATTDVEAYKVPIESAVLSYLAHAKTANEIPNVFNSYCQDTVRYLNNELTKLEGAMAANIANITKNSNMSNDDIAKDFFRKLSAFIHIDGSYVAYGWQNTLGNSVRKLFKKHMHWEPGTFNDDKYANVKAVWAMHPKDIGNSVEEFKKFVQTVWDFEKNAPARREQLRKSIVSTVEAAAKSTEDKATAKAIKNVKSLYMIVLDTEKEIDKYIHFTVMHMSDYLRKSASFKTIASNKE